MITMPDFNSEFITIDGSKGEFIYDDCPVCKSSGKSDCQHTVLICRNCGAPPTAKGCICDAAPKWYLN